MIVTVNGKEGVLVFITHNTEWAASSVGELDQTRWGCYDATGQQVVASGCEGPAKLRICRV